METEVVVGAVFGGQPKPTLDQAVKALAERCNYATTWDHQGFSKFDADFGHKMANLPMDRWTFRQAKAVHKMLKKYRKQLAGMGIDYTLIPEPQESPVSPSPSRLDQVTLRHRNTYPLRQDIAALGGRWDGLAKAWVFTTPEMRDVAFQMCEAHGVQTRGV